MTKRDETDQGLDAFFDAARDRPPLVSPDLRARLLADAGAAQPTTPARAPARTPARRGVLAALGGWPVLTGWATAALAGVWIGVALPAAVGDVAFGSFGDEYDFSGFVIAPDVDLGDG